VSRNRSKVKGSSLSIRRHAFLFALMNKFYTIPFLLAGFLYVVFLLQFDQSINWNLIKYFLKIAPIRMNKTGSWQAIWKVCRLSLLFFIFTYVSFNYFQILFNPRMQFYLMRTLQTVCRCFFFKLLFIYFKFFKTYRQLAATLRTPTATWLAQISLFFTMYKNI